MNSNIATPDPLQQDVTVVSNASSPADDSDDGGDTKMTNGNRRGSGQKDTANNGPKYEEAEQPTDYSLFSNPPNLGVMRERIFKVEEPIQLSPLEFDTYFKFMDNVWRKERGGVQDDNGNITDVYCCKLKNSNSKSNTSKHIPDEQRKRKKVVKETQDCDMTMKVIYRGGSIPTCALVHGGGHGVRALKHTHDLDLMDQLKRCTGVMDVARKEANKGFLASSTFEKMWAEPDKMRDAGGAHMKISDARNVQIPWRDANRDVPYKVHTGFTGSRNAIGRRNRTSLPAASPTPKKQRIAKLISETQQPRLGAIPPGTLQYPPHARTFLEDFMPNHSIPRTRLHVTLTYAQSLDGRISLMPGLQTAISGPETKAMTHYLRSRHDAILIGVRTAIADDPALNCRLAGVGGYGGDGQVGQPRPIIIDPDGRLQIRPEMKILQVVAEGRAKAPWVVVKPSAKLRPQSVKTLKSYGGEYMSIRSESNERDISWGNIFKALYAEGIRSIMVEGGGVVLSELLKPQNAYLLDSVIITIAPTFMGKSGTAVCPDSTVNQHGHPVATRLDMVRWQPMGNEDVVMCGRLEVPAPPTNGILSGLEQFANAAQHTNGDGFALANGQQKMSTGRS